MFSSYAYPLTCDAFSKQLLFLQVDWTGWFAMHAGAASWAFDDVAIWMLPSSLSISGLVAEYIVAIDVTRVRFPADAYHKFGNEVQFLYIFH